MKTRINNKVSLLLKLTTMAYTGHLALRGACKVFVGDRNEFTFPTGYSRSLALSVSALELPLEAATT